MGLTSAVSASQQDSSRLSHSIQVAIFWLFHILLLTVPFFFTWVNEELFEFNKMILTYILTVLILGLWSGRMLLEKKWLINRTPFDGVLFLFVASQVLSTLFSIHPRTSVFGYYTRFNGGLLSTFSYVVLFYAFVSQVKVKQLPGFITTALVAGVGVAIYAIPEHFGASPSCFLISEGANFNTACWIQDVQNRVFGTFGQPNWLAAYAVTLIPLGIFWAIAGQPSLEKSVAEKQTHLKKIPSLGLNTILSSLLKKRVVLGFLSVILLWCTLIFTKSRSGMLGAVISLSVFGTMLLGLLIINRKKFPDSHMILRSGIISFSILVIVLLGLGAFFGTPFTKSLSELSLNSQPNLNTKITENVSTTAPTNRLEVGGTDSGEIRKIVWEGAVKVGQRYTLFGSGVETFGYSYYQDRPVAHNLVSEWDFLYNKAHNEFLNYWATTGIVGLMAYCSLIGWFLIWVVKRLMIHQDPPTQLGLAGLGSAIIGLSVTNFFGFSTVVVSTLFWLFLAFAVVLTQSSSPWQLQIPFTLPNFTPFMKKAALTMIGLMTLWGVSTVTNWWLADYDFAYGKRLLESGQTAHGLSHLQAASQRMPKEGIFFDELSITYAQLAQAYQQQNELELVPELIAAAIASSDRTLALNPRHLNFYKNRARVFIILGEIDPHYLLTAQEALETATLLAPTDAKLLYNLALLEAAEGKITEAQTDLEATVALKPNYEAAYLELAKLYQSQNNLDAAAQSYRYVLENIAGDNPTALAGLQTIEASQSSKTN